MRLPLWIGMLSVAGTLMPVACALGQEGKPEQPAAPAAGTPDPATAQPAGQVDPAAKQALVEAADAVKNLGPCTFTIEMRTEGLGKEFKFESTMQVKLIRGKTPNTGAYQMKGDFTSPGAKPEDLKVNAALFEGKTGEWIDDAAKTLFSRPLRGTKTDQASKDVLSKCMTPNKAFEVMLLEGEPFKNEINAIQLEMDKAQVVDGEQCQVVKATLDRNSSAFRYVYISALDKIPRKYVQVMGKPGSKQQVRSFELKDFKDAKLTLDDIHLKVPDGYKVDKVDLPPPPPPQTDAAKKEKEAVKDKVDPAKEKVDPADKRSPEEKAKDKEKQKREELERTRAKVPPDPNVIPATSKPGKN